MLIQFARSSLFMLLMVLWTPPYITSLCCLFWLPARWRRRYSMVWVYVASWLVRFVLRINYRLEGAENIPDLPCVILCKHQSAWETIVLQLVFRLPAFVYKRELHWLPFFGWGMWLMPFVPIDRGAGRDALNQVAAIGKQRLDEGYPVIIFPEGTRTAPGAKRRFKIGGAHLCATSGAPALPVALNSGEFWRRQAFIKRAGTVVVRIGEPIDPAGLTEEEINRRAEEWIETAMRDISPQFYVKPSAAA